MFAILHALGMFVGDLFKSRNWLEADNFLLHHQLTIALRRAPPRLRLRGSDHALLLWTTRLWPSLLDAVQVVQPDLRRVLSAYAAYYNQARTHLALQKDAPLHRSVPTIWRHCRHSDPDWTAPQYVRM